MSYGVYIYEDLFIKRADSHGTNVVKTLIYQRQLWNDFLGSLLDLPLGLFFFGSPLQYSCLEKFHGLRSLVGYNPWGQKESDTTEQLHSLIFLSKASPHYSVQFCHSVVSNSLRCHEPQHTRPPCPSPTPRVYPNPGPSSRWCHPAISSSVVPFSSCPQSFPALPSFPMSQLFAWGCQSIGVSA